MGVYIYISHYTYIPTLIYIYIYKTFTHPSHHPNQGRDVLRLRNDLRHAAHPQSVPGLGRALPGDALHPSHAGGLRLGLGIRGIQFDDAWLGKIGEEKIGLGIFRRWDYDESI